MDQQNVTKYQKFTPKTIHRSKINFAYYNPRKINEESRKKLKNKIKESGLLSALTWNEITGNLVSGHQRLSIIDQLEKNEDYYITVDCVSLTEEEEVKANIFFNNQSAMGEFDASILMEIKDQFKDIDFEKDLGFDKYDLDYMDIPIDNKNKEEVIDTDHLKEMRNNYKKNKKNKMEESGGSVIGDQNDYILTIVFNTNIDKQNFCAKCKVERNEKNIKYTKIYDMLKDEYKV
jgi:hypothetical protein